MTDERIKEEFEKWFNCPMEPKEIEMFARNKADWKEVSYTAGFRTAERLSKIEVLEEVLNYLCGKEDYTIIRCQKVTMDDMRKMFLKAGN